MQVASNKFENTNNSLNRLKMNTEVLAFKPILSNFE